MANPVSDLLDSLRVAAGNAQTGSTAFDPNVRPYDPNAYVPGGASPAVAAAIQAAGYANPGPSPVNVPTTPTTPTTPGVTDPFAGAAGSIVVGPGSTPDYKSLILNDPAYLLAHEGVQSGNLQSAAARAAQVRNALIAFGSIPDFGSADITDPSSGQGYLTEDVDPLTRSLAAKNAQNGTLGQLNYAHTQNLTNLRALMASRGILNSGQDALGEMDEGKQYASGVNNATQSLLQTLQKAQGDYINSYANGQQSLSNVLAQVADRLQSSGAFDPTHGSASLDKTQTAGGKPVYKDANGNYWTADGKPVAKGDLSAYNSHSPAAPPADTSADGGVAAAKAFGQAQMDATLSPSAATQQALIDAARAAGFTQSAGYLGRAGMLDGGALSAPLPTPPGDVQTIFSTPTSAPASSPIIDRMSSPTSVPVAAPTPVSAPTPLPPVLAPPTGNRATVGKRVAA